MLFGGMPCTKKGGWKPSADATVNLGGRRLFSISGDVARPGRCTKSRIGITPLRELIESPKYCGGVINGPLAGRGDLRSVRRLASRERCRSIRSLDEKKRADAVAKIAERSKSDAAFFGVVAEDPHPAGREVKRIRAARYSSGSGLLPAHAHRVTLPGRTDARSGKHGGLRGERGFARGGSEFHRVLPQRVVREVHPVPAWLAETGCKSVPTCFRPPRLRPPAHRQGSGDDRQRREGNHRDVAANFNLRFGLRRPDPAGRTRGSMVSRIPCRRNRGRDRLRSWVQPFGCCAGSFFAPKVRWVLSQGATPGSIEAEDNTSPEGAIQATVLCRPFSGLRFLCHASPGLALWAIIQHPFGAKKRRQHRAFQAGSQKNRIHRAFVSLHHARFCRSRHLARSREEESLFRPGRQRRPGSPREEKPPQTGSSSSRRDCHTI